YMMGAFAGFTLLSGLGTAFIHVHSFLVIPLAFIVPMAVAGLLGGALERVAYRPLRRAPRLSPLITAIGVSLALEMIALNVWGASFQIFPSIITSVTWTIGGAIVTS